VAFVVVLLGVGSGYLGGSAVGLAGARSWDRCVWVAVVRMSERRLRKRLSRSRVSPFPLKRKSRRLMWCAVSGPACCVVLFGFRSVSLINRVELLPVASKKNSGVMSGFVLYQWNWG
jgi:hypothetical protein